MYVSEKYMKILTYILAILEYGLKKSMTLWPLIDIALTKVQ